ncbi:MAG: 16S rRNA (uracil(1498)-N(3))-methyltransferase [Ilumatobacter sp.]|nr:16S rRNA (uracil(1498)-N(3))-methyltransferase [Ilumatobacter sp.]
MNPRRHSSAHVFVDHLGDTIDLSDETAHHLARVLRLRDGDPVTVSDGAGHWQPTVVTDTGTAIRLESAGDVVHEPRRHEPLTLATAMPKGDRLDWLVQKATEIGVDRIALLHTDRSVVRWKPDRVERRLGRLQRISDEAARQSRRVWRVAVDAPVPADIVLAGAAVAEPGGRELRPADSVVAVGPEGGWSDTELQRASVRIDLGPNVLRTETAALVIITLSVAFRHRILGLRDELD